jgi:hypothetical protein
VQSFFFLSLLFLFSGTEVNSSEQQTNEVLAVEPDTVGIEDTTIADHQGTTGTCDLHQKNTQAPVLIVTGMHGNLQAPTSSFVCAHAYRMSKFCIFCSIVSC